MENKTLPLRIPDTATANERGALMASESFLVNRALPLNLSERIGYFATLSEWANLNIKQLAAPAETHGAGSTGG